MQQVLQRMLEEEVDGVLGRARYERRNGVDAVPGYRNGFGQPRRLSLSNGTITLRRPRVRGLSERFESRLLPAFKRRTEEVGRLLPELYLHGKHAGRGRERACSYAARTMAHCRLLKAIPVTVNDKSANHTFHLTAAGECDRYTPRAASTGISSEAREGRI